MDKDLKEKLIKKIKEAKIPTDVKLVSLIKIGNFLAL